MNYLTDEWLIDWAKRNCKSKEQLDAEKAVALENANKVLSKLDGVEITVEPIIFDVKEFESAHAFAVAMSIASKRYADTDDILVRYTKPEDKETHEIYIQFHVLKSKAKMFQKFMNETDETFEFSVETSNEIKSCVKYLNSLGTKGEGGEPLSSKETDYAKDMKDALTKGENKVFVMVKYDDELGTPLLEWNLVGADYECANFEEVKNKIDAIIKS
jgi:hypothetical protein